ncbi:hypothetical protein BJF78_12025 [Pseudonocardia sp. CNS-139]|nr:hypothetical protein BJF78_12025 [Pseudonocardia sp. CNS-139]
MSAQRVTPEEFDGYFDTFRQTVSRLEVLPAYDVGGAEGDRIAAFLTGRARPERSVRTSPWLARIARTTVVDGKVWTRVRVVDDPLTDYERYEFSGYVESQAAGERILVVRRDEVGDVGPDFWLFDADTPQARALLMDYDEAGHWLGADLITDPDRLAELSGRLQDVEALAVPLNEYLSKIQ